MIDKLRGWDRREYERKKMKEVKEVKEVKGFKGVRVNDVRIHGKDLNQLKISFGPHHFLNIYEEDQKLYIELGATHHGVKLQADEVDGELYQAIEYLREKFPQNIID